MKSKSCTMGSIVAMTVLLLAGGSVAAGPPAGANVAPSSCGGVALPPSGNAFCSFESDGSGVVIGHHSCNVEGACLLLGNGVRIGNDSCNGETACAELGGAGGTSTIGNRSCDGDFACWAAGYQGRSVIGDNSCNGGSEVCEGVAMFGGNSRIGNGSCNDGLWTCLFLGAGDFEIGGFGSSDIGNSSCIGNRACTFAGQYGGSSVIGNNSCLGERSCFDVAQDDPYFSGLVGSVSRIGNNSCDGLRGFRQNNQSVIHFVRTWMRRIDGQGGQTTDDFR